MVETGKPEQGDPPPGVSRGVRGPRLLGGVLWMVFGAFVVAGGWLFLQACGLSALGLNYCPAHADRSALVREAAIGDDLARQVHMAQLAVAEAPVCASPTLPPAPVTLPKPDMTPPPRSESEALDRTVVERGGRNGNLQFTLEWGTLDDLDLNVDCPGGRIDSKPQDFGPGICGDGRKDIDANRNLKENISTSPIENVVWQTDVPTGTYRVEIIEFKAATGEGTTVPFTLRIRWHGQERICQGSVSTLPESTHQFENGHLIGGTEQLLTWSLSDDLPACDFKAADTYRSPDFVK